MGRICVVEACGSEYYPDCGLSFHRIMTDGNEGICNEGQGNNISLVQSVGNAWVICNSKSRPGYKYYFNTASGAAVWNLSDAEIEKAKKVTKNLATAELEKCPEPKEPPMDSTNQNSSDVFKNQFPVRAPNMFNIWNSVPSTSALNPNIWNTPGNLPIGPQHILVPILTPFNQATLSLGLQGSAQTTLQHAQTNYVHNSYARNWMPNRGRRMHNNWRKNRFTQGQHNLNRLSQGNSDLREKLTRKRSLSQSAGENTLPDIKQETNSETAEDIFRDILNDSNEWQNDIKEESPPMLTKLKQLNTSDIQNKWFIVVDLDILLRNFGTLTSLIDPDHHCYLMVPDHVMTELQALSDGGRDVGARRVYRFLSQQIEGGHAFRGDKVGDIPDDAMKIFHTCIKLAEYDNNVVLVSDNIDMCKYKDNDYSIYVLKMNEFKKILLNGPTEQLPPRANSPTLEPLLNGPAEQLPPRANSPTLEIKIMVDNDMKQKHASQAHDKMPMTSKKNIQCDTESLTTFNKKEVGVQADNAPSLNTLTLPTVNSEIDVDCVDHTAGSIKTPESPQKAEVTSNDSYFYYEKKKEIRLNRSTSQKSETEQVAEKRQFKWRKKRGNSSSAQAQFTLPQPWSDIRTDQMDKPEKVSITDTHTNTDSCISMALPIPSFTLYSNDSYDSGRHSESGRKTAQKNVVVEETSTSVISNTNDSESLSSSSRAKEKKITFRKAVMFEVAGQSMAEVLKMRREEWVLRFVQIMEEVLREKLREESPFHSNDPASWAIDIHEAARCIIKKYSNDFAVVDAANKLSFVLYKITDDKGNIGPDIEPAEYMEMYSYGVYLVETLKDVTANCEDLQTADESLKKLLYDIQNANLDSAHNDTFADDPHEPEPNVTGILDIEEEIPHVPSTIVKDNTECRTQIPQQPTTVTKHTTESRTDIAQNIPSIAKYSTRSRTEILQKQPAIAEHNTESRTEIPQKPPTVAKDTTESSAEVSHRPPAINKDTTESHTPKIDRSNTSSKNSSYGLRSRKSKKTQPHTEPKQKVVRVDSESSFFAGLHLQKKTSSISPLTEEDTPQDLFVNAQSITPQRQNNKQFSPKSPSVSPSNVQGSQETASVKSNLIDDTKENSGNAVQSTFIRKFTIDPQFEARLRNKNAVSETDDFADNDDEFVDENEVNYNEHDHPNKLYDDELFDYDGDYPDEYNSQANDSQEYDSQENDPEEYDSQENEPQENDENDLLEDGETAESVTSENCNIEETNVDANVKKFRAFVGLMLTEIKMSFNQVMSLCNELMREVKNPQVNPVKRQKLKIKGEKALHCIELIRKSLDSMLNRSFDSNNNLKVFLKNAGAGSFQPNEQLCSEYRTIISKCKDQADVFQSSLGLIMKRYEQKPPITPMRR